MKILCCMLILAVLLAGCSSQQTFETIGDDYAQPVSGEMKEISLRLPGDASAQMIRGEDGMIYLCDGYDVAVQTMLAGDLSGTVKTISGFPKEDLTVMETVEGDLHRYEFVWTAAGEGGDVVCRGLILDDGLWHYCVTVTAGAQEAADLISVWQELLESVSVV